MLQRFRAFLELAFRELTPTKDSEQYKAELLNQLMASAEELKLAGEKDENVIYKTSIEKLGDFKEKFVNFKKVEQPKTAAKKILNMAIIAGVYMLVIVAVFLIVSFTTSAWAKTWLLPTCGAIGGVVALFVYLSVMSGKKHAFIKMRLCIALAMFLSILITYLCFSVLYPVSVWHASWLLFLFAPIIISGVDLIIAIIVESKHIIVSIAVFIMLAMTMLYVILGVTAFVPWHPYWLMPAVAGIVDVILITLGIRFRLFGKN